MTNDQPSFFDGITKALSNVIMGLTGQDKMISPVAQPSPTPSPIDQRTQIANQIRMGQQPQIQQQPENTPAPFFDYRPYQVSPGPLPPQPPAPLAHTIANMFPQEATKAALTAATENGGFNPNAYNQNTNNTGDYGIMQMNSGTLHDFLRRFPNSMKSIGVKTVEDLRDPMKNLSFAKLVKQSQGWGAWYGPKNRGFDLVSK